jgi:adenylate cyclase
VGSAVNVASRVESATVGGQVLLTAATLTELGDLARVGPRVQIQVKGLSEPLTLHELHGLGGRFAQSSPLSRPDSEPQVAVDLPLECWVIDGKIVRSDATAGRIVRLGRREVLARLDPAPASLTNLKLALRYPPPIDRVSGAIYAKAMGRDADGLVRLRLTAVGAPDEEALARLVDRLEDFTSA